MRKALVPMIASLALCGAATCALIATNARAASAPKKPVMVAMVTSPAMPDVAPPMEGGLPNDMMDAAPGDMGGMPMDGKMGEHFKAHMTQMCKDMYAHKVGELAFEEARLALTPAQTGAFAHWKQVSLEIAQRHVGECNARIAKMEARFANRDKKDGKKMHNRGNPVDRMAREEEMLKARLADLQSERPALEALYNALTPDQRRELGHPGMGGGRPMHGMMMGMMHRPGMGPMGMGPGPMGPHGPANAPPPPPPL
jgi:hypothetical protein